MSIVIPVAGNIQQPVSLLLTTTNVTDVLSIAAATPWIATVVGITIVNEDSSARIVTVWWNDGTSDYALFERSVGANETVTVALDAPILLYPKVAAKKIKAQAAAANVVTVTVIWTMANQNTRAG